MELPLDGGVTLGGGQGSQGCEVWGLGCSGFRGFRGFRGLGRRSFSFERCCAANLLKQDEGAATVDSVGFVQHSAPFLTKAAERTAPVVLGVRQRLFLAYQQVQQDSNMTAVPKLTHPETETWPSTPRLESRCGRGFGFSVWVCRTVAKL